MKRFVGYWLVALHTTNAALSAALGVWGLATLSLGLVFLFLSIANEQGT